MYSVYESKRSAIHRGTGLRCYHDGSYPNAAFLAGVRASRIHSLESSRGRELLLNVSKMWLIDPLKEQEQSTIFVRGAMLLD